MFGIARAMADIRRRPGLAALSTASVASVLVLLAVVHLAARNVEALTEQWADGVQMVVYLDEGIDLEHAEQLAVALRRIPAVERVDYVSPLMALERLRGALGERDEVMAEIEVGMLPASLEVHLGDGIADVAMAHPVVERLTSTPGVEEVEFLGEWVEQFDSLLSGIRAASSVLLIFVTIVCVFVVSVTMRLSIRERHDEAKLLKLLGASDPFLRFPLFVRGVLQGAAGGVLAAFGAWLLYRSTADSIESALSAAFGSGSLVFFDGCDVLMLVGLGAATGLVGVMIATGKHRLA